MAFPQERPTILKAQRLWRWAFKILARQFDQTAKRAVWGAQRSERAKAAKAGAFAQSDYPDQFRISTNTRPSGPHQKVRSQASAMQALAIGLLTLICYTS